MQCPILIVLRGGWMIKQTVTANMHKVAMRTKESLSSYDHAIFVWYEDRRMIYKCYHKCLPNMQHVVMVAAAVTSN